MKSLKDSAMDKYAPAVKLSGVTDMSKWLAVFPTRKALLQFRSDVGFLSWPESMGSSPWGFAYSVAFHVAEGFSATSQSFYNKYCEQGDRYALAEVSVVKFYLGLPS